jgi:hypothetical protein
MRYFKSILKAIMTIAAEASRRHKMTKGMKAATSRQMVLK